MAIGESFERLVGIMAQLRAPDGCPWDREQTHESLRQYLIEEAYEVLEAIDEKNDDELRKELGDLLLQVLYHSQIASEEKRFDVQDVIHAISDKMIRRHPHVFGSEKVDSAEEQTLRWEEIKKKEGKTSVIDGVPRALPALQRAARLQQKANAATPHQKQLKQLVDSFIDLTLKYEKQKHVELRERLYQAYGLLLFSLVALGRKLEFNAEDALRETCEKFVHKFQSQRNEQSNRNRD